MRVPSLVSAFLFFALSAFLAAGCATGPPPASPTPAGKTLSFQVNLNDAGSVSTQFNSTASKTYLGTYRIVINTLNTSLIGNQTAVTTSPDTWTDYFQLDSTGWTRNHRIALPNSQQPQQWSGFQAVTPGTISSSGNSFTLALSLPDQYLGAASIFNASVITYIAPASNPLDLHPIDSLGPTLTNTQAINYISFNSSVSTQNTLTDSGGLGDWLAYPADFPDLTNSNYQNFDVKSLSIFIQ